MTLFLSPQQRNLCGQIYSNYLIHAGKNENGDYFLQLPTNMVIVLADIRSKI